MTDPTASDVSVYRVGLAIVLWQFWHSKAGPRRWSRLRRGLGYPFRQARRGDWRAARNYFNGWLAEPHEMPAGLTRCGSGWTASRARRDLARRIAAQKGR